MLGDERNGLLRGFLLNVLHESGRAVRAHDHRVEVVPDPLPACFRSIPRQMDFMPLCGEFTREHLPICHAVDDEEKTARKAWYRQHRTRILLPFRRSVKVRVLAFAISSLYNASVSDEARNRNVILLATAILVAPLRELRDSPALRSAVADAVRVAKYIARVVDASLRSDGVL